MTTSTMLLGLVEALELASVFTEFIVKQQELEALAGSGEGLTPELRAELDNRLAASRKLKEKIRAELDAL